MPLQIDPHRAAPVLAPADIPWILRRVLPFAIGFAGLLVLENVAVAKMDLWLPVRSFEVASTYAVYISAVAQWLRICVIGMAIFATFNARQSDRNKTLRRVFLSFWCIVGLVFTLPLSAIDLWFQALGFAEEPLSEATMRWLWLASLYVRVALFYVAARLLLGAMCLKRDRPNRWTAAWTAFTTWQSLMLFLALLVVKLVVDDVLVSLISFIPVISPFWFIPNELSPMRYLVGQGVEIAAESCGVFVFVAFWIVAERWVRGADPSVAERPWRRLRRRRATAIGGV